MKVVKNFENNNVILGVEPIEKNSKIIFKGKNNVLICEEKVRLENSSIIFYGDNSIVYLSSNRSIYYLNVNLYNNSVLFIDENNYMNGKLNLILAERKHIFIGKDGMFSFGIWVRVADAHLIYDIETMSRKNKSNSVFIGDHVWVGQESLIFKGSQIGSGSIIGARSIVSNKKICSNSSWAGSPVRKIQDGIFFDKESVHGYTEEQTVKSQKYDSKQWIYANDGNIERFDEIEKLIDNTNDINKRIEILENIRNNSSHNRFYVKPQ